MSGVPCSTGRREWLQASLPELEFSTLPGNVIDQPLARACRRLAVVRCGGRMTAKQRIESLPIFNTLLQRCRYLSVRVRLALSWGRAFEAMHAIGRLAMT